jgi:hypothetical protein
MKTMIEKQKERRKQGGIFGVFQQYTEYQSIPISNNHDNDNTDDNNTNNRRTSIQNNNQTASG